MDTNVIIFFVGLTVFSSQIPNDLGMKAILPRVVYVDPTISSQADQVANVVLREPIRVGQALLGQASRPAPPPAPAPASASASAATPPQQGSTHLSAGHLLNPFGPQRHVEDHKAVIIFPNSVYHPSSSWPKTTLQTDSNYSYVELKGDSVRFLTQPPAVAPPFTKAELILPPLTKLCPGMNPLHSRYLPPYQGAAAVFDLADEGELSSCSSVTKAGPPAFRYDSKLKLKTTGTFFVVSASTMTTTKELRLDLRNLSGSLNIYIGNIPEGYLAGNFNSPSPSAINGVSHVRAYYDMGRNASTCSKPLKDWYDDPVSAASDVPPCGFTFTGAGIAPGPGGSNPKNGTQALLVARPSQPVRVPIAIPGEIAPGKISVLNPAAMTFECSNTNWP